MSMFRHVAICASIYTLMVASVTLMPADTYGPYNLEIQNLSICKGPKRQNATKTSMSFIKTENDFILNINVTFLERARIEELRMRVFKVTKTEMKLLFTKKINNFCQSFLGAELAAQYNISSDCVIPKGHQEYRANVMEIFRHFLGKSFFYGTFLMKSVTLSNRGNVYCVLSQLRFSKKNN